MFDHLLAHRGKVVSKDDLMDAVWPDVEVTENSLYQCIAEIRKQLGPETGLTLSNVPGRGYVLEQTEATERPRARWRWVTAAAVAVATAMVLGGWLAVWNNPTGDNSAPSIHIEPFENMSDNSHWSRLGQALAADIAGQLALNAWLDVTSKRTASAIEARYVLSGDIQEQASEIQVQARLSSSDTGVIVWADKWRGAESDWFDMQDAISTAVSGALGAEWSGAIARSDRSAAHLRGTDDLDAYEHFLIGTEYKHRFTPAAYLKSAEHLRRAIEIDPSFHKAWSTLAVVHALQGSNASTPSELRPIMEARIAIIEEAMRLKPDDPQTLVQRNWLEGHRWDFDRAEKVIRRAVELAPANADVLAEAAWVGNWRNVLGESSVEWSDRSKALNETWPEW
ncbi:winged helix-turn-helix domain-containing protein [Primorskyibacter aestuariivivens]|uniref:winged helix-turn-helix domain-containing protein n=1 Tax=Primorskyibacter aestuariivivens TaxID=1888912 RepID=UPI0023001C35|nr:winged helix-turn-helix domain-containing protein [Primorskyibacter aestuariivivens]MDA7428805.1 winged helix-turn-helix domain-containing protein [Primorskyibacter aestuariivivens]